LAVIWNDIHRRLEQQAADHRISRLEITPAAILAAYPHSLFNIGRPVNINIIRWSRT